MREKDVEKYFREQVREAGGRAYKFVSPGNAGVPDRIALFPKARAYFVELKAPGKKRSPLQEAQGVRLGKLGFKVRVIDTKEKVDAFIREVNSQALGNLTKAGDAK